MSKLVPLRGAALIERCAYCEEPAQGTCSRCNRPLCVRHGRDGKRRCDHCEGEHERQLSRIEPVDVRSGIKTAVSMTALSAAGSAAAFGGVTALFATLAVLLGGIGVGKAAVIVLYVSLIAAGLGATTFALLAVPFLGLGSGVAATRAIRRRLERHRFLSETPGRRRLTSGKAPLERLDDDDRDDRDDHLDD